MIDSGKRTIFVIMLVATLLFSASPVISAKNYLKNSERFIIYVPDDFPTIQDAINHTVDGDTIIVRDGTYYEHIVVDKSITLKSENGSANCIINGSGTGTVVDITANNVTLQGFTITNGGNGFGAVEIISSGNTIANNKIYNNNKVVGILLWPPSSNNTIINNQIYNNAVGIEFIYFSSKPPSNNVISSNTIYNNQYDGIELSFSNNTTITNNYIYTNGRYGIYVMAANNTITHNTLVGDSIFIDSSYLSVWINNIIDTSNTVNGKPVYYLKNFRGGKVPEGVGEVILANCTNVRVENQNLGQEDVGIEIGFSSNCLIYNNTIHNNSWYGIYLSVSNNNTIASNELLYNITDGAHIYLKSSSNNLITSNTIYSELGGIALTASSNNNTITYNTLYGENINDTWVSIDIYSSSNNLIYLNNFIKSPSCGFRSPSTNRWYSPTAVPYTYDGSTYTSYLGNYWSDYTGSDANGDGIGDTPYVVDINDNTYTNDSYPLMKTIDNYTETIPPQITITYPSTNAIVNSSTVTVNWQGSDYWTGIDHYEIKIDNLSWINVGLDTTYTYTSLSDGQHTVTVKAVDRCGNTATDSISFTVDTTSPAVTITSPSDNSLFNSSTVTVNWSGNDSTSGINHYKVHVDTNPWINVSTNTSYTFTNLSDGPHTAYVRAYDNAGNYADTSVSFTVDTTTPTIIITSPLNNSYLNFTNITVKWSGSDTTSGIEHYEVCIDTSPWINVGASTSYTFTSLSNGYHTVYVRAYDKAGNIAITSVNFTVDTTTPNITITSPTNNEIFNTSTITVTWQGNDSTSGIDHYEVKIDNGLWINAGLNTSYTFAGLQDGNHTVYVKAVDKAGNEGISAVAFVVDTAGPDITVIYPQNNSIINKSTVTIIWNSSDSISGVDHYEISIDSGAWINVGLNTSYTFTGVSDGNHTAYVKAYDKAGNMATKSVTFAVDTTTPNIQITYPNSNSILNTNNVIVNWTCSDNVAGIDHYEVRIDNASWINIGLNTSYLFTSLSDGYHTVEVKAVDKVGNTATTSVTFAVDTTPPNITITSPTQNSALNTTSVTVVWDGSDNLSGIEHYEVKIDNTYWINVGLNTSYTALLANGLHTVEIKAVDNVGNSATKSVTFFVDTIAPQVSITSPSDGSLLNISAVTVSWSGSDSGSGIGHYEIKIDSGLWLNVGLNTSYTFTNLSDDLHNVVVKAVDKAGNTATDSLSFTVDTIAPQLNITLPYNGAILNTSEITVRWIGNDNGSGIEHYEISVDGGPWINVGTNTSYTVQLSDDSHAFYVKVVDRAGNENITSITFLVDTTTPNLTIIEPHQGEIFNSSTVTITWNGSDNGSGIDHYEICIDNASWINVSINTSYTFTSLSDGYHTVYVKAVDRVGNIAITKVSFTIDTMPPQIQILYPSNNIFLNNTYVTVEWNGTDVSYYEIRMDNSQWINIGTNTQYTFTSLSDGPHTIYVKAVDMAGNQNITSTTFIVDTTSPSLTIIAPQNNMIYNVSAVTVNWEGNDNLSGIDHYEIMIDNTSWINIGLNTSYTFTNLSDGSHIFKVKAVDKAGNEKISEEYTIKIDTKPPIIEIKGNYTLINNNIVMFNVTDENLYSIKIYLLENGTWILYAENTTTIKLNHTGKYTFKIVAEDLAGNKNEKVTTVSYQISQPYHPKTPDIWGLIISLIIFLAILAAIFIALLTLLKKRKEKEESKKEEERELTSKEKAILESIKKYVREQPGTTREDLIKTVSARMGITEEEVAVILDYALENYLLIQEVDEEGMKRIYLLDEEKEAEENA